MFLQSFQAIYGGHPARDDRHPIHARNGILLGRSLILGLDDAVSTILTVIHHIRQTGNGVLEDVEVMAQQVDLDQRLLLGHGRELDVLLANKLAVFLVLGNKQVGEVGNARNGSDLCGGQTLLAFVDNLGL